MSSFGHDEIAEDCFEKCLIIFVGDRWNPNTSDAPVV